MNSGMWKHMRAWAEFRRVPHSTSLCVMDTQVAAWCLEVGNGNKGSSVCFAVERSASAPATIWARDEFYICCVIHHM